MSMNTSILYKNVYRNQHVKLSAYFVVIDEVKLAVICCNCCGENSNNEFRFICMHFNVEMDHGCNPFQHF